MEWFSKKVTYQLHGYYWEWTSVFKVNRWIWWNKEQFISKRIRDAIAEVEPTNVIQIMNDNVGVCKATCMLI